MQCSVVYSGIGVACTDTVTMPTFFVFFVFFVCFVLFVVFVVFVVLSVVLMGMKQVETHLVLLLVFVMDVTHKQRTYKHKTSYSFGSQSCTSLYS